MPTGKKITELESSGSTLADISGLKTLGVDATNLSKQVPLGDLLLRTIERAGAIYNMENEHPEGAPYTLDTAAKKLQELADEGKEITKAMCNGIILEYFDHDSGVWRLYQINTEYDGKDTSILTDTTKWMELAVTSNVANKADKSYVDEQLEKKANAEDVYTKTELDEALKTTTETAEKKLDANQGEENQGKVLVVGEGGVVSPAEASADGNTINLGKPTTGYYTLATAIEAVPSTKRKPGLCITYMTATNTWDTRQYTDTDLENWKDEAKWQQVAGSSSDVDTVLNASSDNPVANSAVAQRIFDLENTGITKVDDSLNTTSTNPVQNAAVATAIESLQKLKLDSDVDDYGDGQQLVTLSQNGNQVAQFVITGGSGGTSSQTSKIKLSASVSESTVRVGGSSVLSWYYNHINADGNVDGILGEVTVSVKRGAATLHEETLSNVVPSALAHTIVLDSWLTAEGTIGITINATAVDNGTQQSKQYYVAVTVVSLQLSLNNASTLIAKAMEGGYASSDTIFVGYTVKGNGTKVVKMYIDGGSTPTTTTVTKSGTTNGQFTIDASTLAEGRHVVQIVAENDYITSESTYIDILVAGSSDPFIGLYCVRDDGTILYSPNHTTPIIAATQYAISSFQYFAYDPSTSSATLNEYRDGTFTRTFTVGRAAQTSTDRYTEAGTITMKYVCGSTTYTFKIVVAASSIDVSKATSDLAFELSAAGRSNDESDPAVWTDGAVTTSFSGFDWKSSGWNGDALIIKNGAKIIVDYKPFDAEVDPASTGKTIEFEFKISNIVEKTSNVISCVSENKGFRITGEKASLLTGSTATYTDEEGATQTRAVGLEKAYAEDTDIKMAFVIGKRAEYRLMELYINGSREKADIYNVGDNFVQDTPVGITFDSSGADIELRNMRVYNRALSDDEEVDNYIVDRKTIAEMLEKYEDNDVLDGGEYDMTKILSKGKGVVHIVREQGLDEVNSANNKKTDFLATVYYYSPFGDEWDLRIDNCYMRIQGTSSTKYPSKNYRIYILKGSADRKVYRKNTSGAWVEQTDVTGYQFRSTDREAPLICLKADYSDSSMTMNTGGAKLFDSLMRELGYLTPPQKVDTTVRQAIDGFPVDVFCTDTNDVTNSVVYYGQYNFNHDKGKSWNIFGHTSIKGDDGAVHSFGKSIALESLNNTNAFCLYQSAGSQNSAELDEQLEADFDGGFEFNYPEDVVWADATDAQKTAIKRLFGWVYDCMQQTAGVQAGTMTIENPDYGTYKGWSDESKAKWVCSKFRNELSSYFHVMHLLTYYVFTDYFMSVDQRAKNTLLRTWDYYQWYITYYDGDTQLGKRNDSFLVYDHTLSRDTWDADKSKYAFEGHDSWLWCLVLANFEDELRDAAKAMRNILTNNVVFNMLNVEQQGNWCERAYNKSGELKYIKPATEGVTVIQNGVTTTGVKYPFIYALDGTNQSHRINIILKRFAMLDSKYGCDTYKSDNVEMYLSRLSTDAAGTIKITSNSPYSYDWNTKNGSHSDPQEAGEGDEVTLTFAGAITVNDPIDLYGASCMRKIDLSGVVGSLQNGINLNKATVLREIDASSEDVHTQSWFFNFEQCSLLRYIDCTNQQGVKTGTNSSTEFNVSNQSRLEVLKLGGTTIQSIETADGAPITTLVLPSTITNLKLRYLPKLQADGLIVQDYTSIKTLNIAGCPNLDWSTIAGMCPNLDRVRVEGINMEDDGTLLEQFKDYRGVDANGNATAKCQLVGDVYLKSWMDPELVEAYRAAYPSLNIHQPEYSVYVFDDTVADPANITNLDNNTVGDSYVHSGHIDVIHDNFIPVYGKLNDDGNFEAHPMNTSDYKKLPDDTDFDYADSNNEGYDCFKRFPHCWIKGVNDYKNQKKYIFWSSNTYCPSSTATKISRSTINKCLYKRKVAVYPANITVGTSTLLSDGVLTADSEVNTYEFNVEGMKQVRYPGINSADIGACFLNAKGVIISTYSMYNDDSMFDFYDGDYIFIDVPDGAVNIVFSTKASVDTTTLEVIAVDSDNIEAIEPDWVEVNPFLVAIYEVSVDSTYRIRSLSGQGVHNGNSGGDDWTWEYDDDGEPTNAPTVLPKGSMGNMLYMAHVRGKGYQLIDYEMSKMVALLFFCYIGNRDVSSLCGYGWGRHNNLYVTGTLDSYGNEDGLVTAGTNRGVSKVFGLEAWYSCSYEYMENAIIDPSITYKEFYSVYHLNAGSANRKTQDWVVYDPITQTERRVLSNYMTDNIARVRWGRYCDVIPASPAGNTDYVTYYADGIACNGYTNGSVARALCNGVISGGLIFADTGVRYTSCGWYYTSRIAFRPPQGKKIIIKN